MNEEIKEILNKFDKVLENYELDKKTKSFTVDSICHLFPNEMIIILNYITNLQKENKILRENAEHNDKVVDKVNWENQKLVKVIDELEKILEFEKNDYSGNIDIETHNIDSEFLRGNSWEADYILNKLTELKGGSSDEK